MNYISNQLILDLIPPKEAFFAALVCKEWYSILQDKQVYRKYETSYEYITTSSLLEYTINNMSVNIYNIKFQKCLMKNGTIGLVESLSKKVNGIKLDIFESAALYGRLDIMKWLHENMDKIFHNCPSDNEGITNTHFNRVGSMIGTSSDNNICIGGISLGNGDENIVDVPNNLTVYDCQSNNTSTNQYITIISNAATYGNLDNIKWLLKKDFKLTNRVFKAATLKGDLTNMKWLKTNECPIQRDIFNIALENGDLDNIKWLHHNGYLFDTSSLNVAIRHGSLVNMKWLFEHGCQLNSGNYNSLNADIPVMSGNLDCMKWLLEKGCSFNRYGTFDKCLEHGDLDIMKWLHENGASFTMHTMRIVSENGNLEHMKWLLDNECPLDESNHKDIINNVTKLGNLNTMKWLFEQGCPFNKYTLDEAVIFGDLDNIKWLIENGCEFSEDAFTYALKNGRCEIMEWLYEMNCPNSETFSLMNTTRTSCENIDYMLLEYRDEAMMNKYRSSLSKEKPQDKSKDVFAGINLSGNTNVNVLDDMDEQLKNITLNRKKNDLQKTQNLAYIPEPEPEPKPEPITLKTSLLNWIKRK